MSFSCRGHAQKPTIGAGEQEAVKQLMADAALAMQVAVVSVTDNAKLTPGKDKHDYYSWAPYLWPNPDTKTGYPYINRDGMTNPETEAKSDKPLLRRMAVAAHTLALAYQYSGESKYAQRSAKLISTWFLDPETKMNPNLNFAQCTPGIEKGSATGIIDSRWFTLVIDAEKILKDTPYFSSQDQKNLKKWFSDYLSWLLNSELGQGEANKINNHATWYAVQTAKYALFTENIPLTRKIITSSKRFFDAQIDSLGRQKFELRRTKSFDYSLYNLHALIALAEIGDQVGVDLWHYNMQAGNKKNILESIRYLSDFAGEDPKWPFKQIAPKAIGLGYEDSDHFSVYYPYDLCRALRIGYAVYQDKSLLDILNTLPQDLAQKNRSVLLIPLH
jgi:hypothetical protein